MPRGMSIARRRQINDLFERERKSMLSSVEPVPLLQAFQCATYNCRVKRPRRPSFVSAFRRAVAASWQ